MKLNITSLLVCGIALSLATSGCRHKTPPITNLPNGAASHNPNESGMGNGGVMDNGTGGSAGGSTSAANPNGTISLGGGHPGWLVDSNTFASDTVYFDFDSAAIKDSESSKIASVAAYLSSNPKNAVQVEGHCDERGTEEYNRALGERRALAIRESLVRLGVAPDRVDTISYGEDRPVDPGHNEEAWHKNRRGVFDLLSPP